MQKISRLSALLTGRRPPPFPFRRIALMPHIRSDKTSFTSGELADELLARTDLRAYQNGARRLRNVFIQPTGGVTRRAGLRYVATALGPGRLAAFEFNVDQVYLLVFVDHTLDIYREGSLIARLATPWTLAQVRQLNWTQSADKVLIVHPDVAPKQLTRLADGRWDLADWTMAMRNVSAMCWPHYKFAADHVQLTPLAITGNITIWASADVFRQEHLGTRLRLNDREVIITGVISGYGVYALVLETLIEPWTTTDWTEQAWSNAHGWPTSVCFHQDRLVVGGSRDLPNRLWMSKSGEFFSFELGEGLDDEAIEFPILSDQVNAIRHVFSGRHLQVFTSGGEWMVAGDPLTPTSVQVRRQTRVGSPVDRTVSPRDVDGATLFVPRTGPQLREFLYTDAEQAYQASDLALLAHHLIDQPVDMDFDKTNRLLHLVNAGGQLATVTIFREEAVTAWTLQKTAGNFLSVAAVGDEMFALVERAGGFFVEVFDDRMQLNSGLYGSTATPTWTWSGVAHLEGQLVAVVADGVPLGGMTVTGGQVVLAQPATNVQLGLPFVHTIEPLPPATDAGALTSRLRPIAVSFRLWESGALCVDLGKGKAYVPLPAPGDDNVATAPLVFSGDKRLRVAGWQRGGVRPLWRIEQEAPLPFTLLSATLELSVGS